MANIPANRTEASTIQEHVADHNILATFHNLIDAAGDLIVGTGVDTAGRLAKGAALNVLRVNAAATALEWSAPVSGIGGDVDYGTTTELADVAAVEGAGVSALVSRADHIHYHGTGYLPNAHHNQVHDDSDHSGPNKVDVSVAGALIGTRSKINFVSGASGADNAGAGRVDVTITAGGGAAIPQVITLNTTAGTAAAIPAAVTEGVVGTVSTVRRCKVDLSNATQGRMSIRVSTGTALAGQKWGVQYSADESTWFWIKGTASATTPTTDEYVSGEVGATLTTAWVNLPAGAKADVFLRIVSVDGNASATGAVGQVTLQAK